MRRAALLLALTTACAWAEPPPRVVVPPAAKLPEVTGTWRGALGSLRLVLTLTRGAERQLRGTIDSLDQGVTLDVDHLVVEGAKLRFEIARIGGVFVGERSGDDRVARGTWVQQGAPQPQPLVFERGAPLTEAERKPLVRPRPLDAPVDVQVPLAPAPLRADGKTYLAYELHITNMSRQPLPLLRVVVESDGKTPLASLDGEALAKATRVIGRDENVRPLLPPGGRAVVFVWLTFEAGVPAGLRHRITVDVDGELTVSAAHVGVLAAAAPSLAPPLAGDGWLAANGPSATSGHRRALIPVGGRAHIAQRFAIDWVRVHPDKRTFSGDPAANRSYRAWGAEALAVADAAVVALKDGVPENTPGPTARAVPMTLETIGGNYVVLDLGHGRYAFYAHLQPGSLKVKVGERVKRGQPLGLVGNSGNSTEPHLHFHVGDGVSPLASEGVPYTLTGFRAYDPTTPTSAAKPHKDELPLENTLLDF